MSRRGFTKHVGKGRWHCCSSSRIWASDLTGDRYMLANRGGGRRPGSWWRRGSLGARVALLPLQIKDLGCKAGVVLNPGTSLDTIRYVLPEVDLVLIMSVNPGFGGQKFIESQVGAVAFSQWSDTHAAMVDGGMDNLCGSTDLRICAGLVCGRYVCYCIIV